MDDYFRFDRVSEDLNCPNAYIPITKSRTEVPKLRVVKYTNICQTRIFPRLIGIFGTIAEPEKLTANFQIESYYQRAFRSTRTPNHSVFARHFKAYQSQLILSLWTNCRLKHWMIQGQKSVAIPNNPTVEHPRSEIGLASTRVRIHTPDQYHVCSRRKFMLHTNPRVVRFLPEPNWFG